MVVRKLAQKYFDKAEEEYKTMGRAIALEHFARMESELRSEMPEEMMSSSVEMQDAVRNRVLYLIESNIPLMPSNEGFVGRASAAIDSWIQDNRFAIKMLGKDTVMGLVKQQIDNLITASPLSALGAEIAHKTLMHLMEEAVKKV